MKKIFIVLSILIFCFNLSYGESTKSSLEEARTFIKRGYPNSAIAAFNKALKHEPNNAKIIKEFADYMVEIRNYSYALLLYNKYIALKPKDKAVRNLTLDLYYSLGLYPEALKVGFDYLKNNPNNSEFIEKLIQITKSQNFQKEETILTEKVINIEPKNETYIIRLLEIYIKEGNFKKALNLINSKGIPKGITDEALGYIYLNSDKYNKALNIYKKIYKNNPSKENKEAIKKAKMAKANYFLFNSPRYYSGFYNPLRNLYREDPRDYRLSEIIHYMDRDIASLYAGYTFTGGKITNQNFSEHYWRAFYPVLSTGTNLILTRRDYRIWNNNNQTGIYRQTGFEVYQALNQNLYLSGGYRDGLPGNTYYGQLRFINDKFNISLRGIKDYELQTLEAINNNISYKGIDSYANWNVDDYVVLFGRLSRYKFSDGNYATYHEIGGSRRIYDNNRNTWLDLGIYHSGGNYDFTSPFYFSPTNLSQWNIPLEFAHYFTRNSLLKLTYSYSWGNYGRYHSYSAYVDHKFSNNFFIFGEYIRGLTRAGRFAPLVGPSTRDYEYSVGLKLKF